MRAGLPPALWLLCMPSELRELVPCKAALHPDPASMAPTPALTLSFASLSCLQLCPSTCMPRLTYMRQAQKQSPFGTKSEAWDFTIIKEDCRQTKGSNH